LNGTWRKKGAGAGAFSNLVLQLPRRKAAVPGHDHLQFKGGKKNTQREFPRNDERFGHLPFFIHFHIYELLFRVHARNYILDLNHLI
jgi:hypothetical protein